MLSTAELSPEAKAIITLHSMVLNTTAALPIGASRPPVSPDSEYPAVRNSRSVSAKANTIPVAIPAMLPPLTKPYRANSMTVSTARVRPTDTGPISSAESESKRIQPDIDRQASSCCRNPLSLRGVSRSAAVLLMKYAPAAASTASITHVYTSVSSLRELKVRATPVANIGTKAAADGKNRERLTRFISWNTQRIAPTAITTAT